ncbi:hypothetical protein EZV73_12330 [Acidaminobacter sp. JC074]|uniref:hypothetical protein n=1 Tax=Acidaminobacter sp. JC074 TaxID=2530199 RepID=UPI001F0D27FF|nr:hypothetical protein [Acidaminobacter sp. JC074]MCH4888369.1 hypothetical protein [Acidaminobacter sp. JC074]
MKKTSDKYDDILHLPRHVSKKRPQMPIKDRAAQFAPFSAVVGHNTAVKEAARHTEKRRELDETGKSLVDEKLREIDMHMPDDVSVDLVYFEADALKEGGRYIRKIGLVDKIDIYTRQVHLKDGIKIPIDEIYTISILRIESERD